MNSLQKKRHLGSYYTKGNPFLHVAFRDWFSQIADSHPILEPFAGDGQICKLLQEAGYSRNWVQYDIDESLKNVIHKDTLKEFPKNFYVVLTNPPYLSYHFAKRKKLAIDKKAFGGFPSLYLKAIALALDNSEFVGMIIPESFVTSGFFARRLQAVISLPYQMFDDTDMPTCLALWGPDSNSFEYKLWRGDEYLGKYTELANVLANTPCSERIRFNVLDGEVGLRAIDDTFGPSIEFCLPNLIDDKKIKHSARLVSKISIADLKLTSELLAESNLILNNWRTQTEDVLLTAFKGYRKDGKFRRRLDFANARAILSNALCKVENHSHNSFESIPLF
jgi:hypothetical protein